MDGRLHAGLFGFEHKAAGAPQTDNPVVRVFRNDGIGAAVRVQQGYPFGVRGGQGVYGRLRVGSKERRRVQQVLRAHPSLHAAHDHAGLRITDRGDNLIPALLFLDDGGLFAVGQGGHRRGGDVGRLAQG